MYILIYVYIYIYISVFTINEDTAFWLDLCEDSDLFGCFMTCMYGVVV